MNISLKKIFKNFFLITFLFINKNNYSSTYQDIIINNKVVEKGNHLCERRFNIIKPLLNKFQRPFTTLDIGAAQGYFSFKTAYEYKNSVAVMIQGEYLMKPTNSKLHPHILKNLCKENTLLKNIILLDKSITPEEIKKLSQCEHFDVIYAFNILHHFGKDWKLAADSIFNLGSYVIVELPTYAPKALQDYIAKKAPNVLGKIKKDKKHYSIIRLYISKKNTISNKIHNSNYERNSIYKIKSNFKEKKILKLDRKSNVISIINWHPGINLNTFKELNGVWPTPKSIDKRLNSTNYNIKDNLILKGEDIVEIG